MFVTSKPTQPRTTRPRATSSPTTPRTRSTGIAKPMPSTPRLRAMIAVLMPTSSPRVLMSAPPELPTLIGASVWMKFSNTATPSCPRPVALTMPWVTVAESPSGLPIARTMSPARRVEERPSSMAGRSRSVILRSARSVSGSRPMIFASASRPSASCTRMAAASAMTWWLVTTCPAESTITPEPSDCSRRWR